MGRSLARRVRIAACVAAMMFVVLGATVAQGANGSLSVTVHVRPTVALTWAAPGAGLPGTGQPGAERARVSGAVRSNVPYDYSVTKDLDDPSVLIVTVVPK